MGQRVVAIVTIFSMEYLALGCSQPSDTGGPLMSGAVATSAMAAPTSSACTRAHLDGADFTGILSAPITGANALPGDAQSCEFVTDGFPAITVSIRPGMGNATLNSWTSGKMPLESTAVAGVGDLAMWQLELHELIAKKGNLLCDIQARGLAPEFAASLPVLQNKLGAVCNKIFDHPQN